MWFFPMILLRKGPRYFVQANSFEGLPFFVASVIIAHQHTSVEQINQLAMGYVAARVVYGFCYLMDWPALRSLVFFVGIGCCVSLIMP
jgi:uncharacterized MAPEG superfamily protein